MNVLWGNSVRFLCLRLCASSCLICGMEFVCLCMCVCLPMWVFAYLCVCACVYCLYFVCIGVFVCAFLCAFVCMWVCVGVRFVCAFMCVCTVYCVTVYLHGQLLISAQAWESHPSGLPTFPIRYAPICICLCLWLSMANCAMSSVASRLLKTMV